MGLRAELASRLPGQRRRERRLAQERQFQGQLPVMQAIVALRRGWPDGPDLRDKGPEAADFSINPGYYAGEPARFSDFILESGDSKLWYIRDRVNQLTGREDAADAFTSMIMDMPTLAPSRVVEGVYGLALNGWSYTDEFAAKVKQPQASLVTDDQWNEVRRVYPGISIVGNLVFGDPEASAIIENTIAQAPKRKDATAEVKDNFRRTIAAKAAGQQVELTPQEEQRLTAHANAAGVSLEEWRSIGREEFTLNDVRRWKQMELDREARAAYVAQEIEKSDNSEATPDYTSFRDASGLEKARRFAVALTNGTLLVAFGALAGSAIPIVPIGLIASYGVSLVALYPVVAGALVVAGVVGFGMFATRAVREAIRVIRTGKLKKVS